MIKIENRFLKISNKLYLWEDQVFAEIEMKKKKNNLLEIKNSIQREEII